MLTLLAFVGLFLNPSLESEAGLPPVQEVRVSYYGPGLNGNTMANGEVFDKNCPQTVAHKSLPFGTKVLFRNPLNGRILLTEVKDRGPFVKGREFDLSEGAAKILGFKQRGTATLESIVLLN